MTCARPADVDEWLDAVGIDRAGAHATESELAQARALRDAVRRLAGYVTQDSRPAAVSAMTDVAAALDQVNSAAAELPAPLLALRDGRLELGTHPGASPVTTGLARVAEQAAALLGGRGRRPAARLLRARLRPVLHQDAPAARMVLGRLRQPGARRPPLPAGPRAQGRRVAPAWPAHDHEAS